MRSGLMILEADSDNTATTSAPYLMSSLAILGDSIAATLPVMQRAIFFPDSSVPFVPVMRLRSSTNAIACWKMPANLVSLERARARAKTYIAQVDKNHMSQTNMG